MSNGQTIELSNRELQVLEMVATGASNQEIAQKLVISVNTVKVHLRNIFEKLNVQSRTEAALKAIQEGLVAVENEADTGAEVASAAPAIKSYLVGSYPPLLLPPWQQLYLLLAIVVAMTVAGIPLLPRTGSQTAPDLPVIYGTPVPAPPAPPPSNATNQWVTHSAMPTSRAGLALVAYNEQIFAIGGVRDNNQATRSVEIFDPVTGSWQEGASNLEAIANISGVVLHDKIYVPGGCTNQGQAVASMSVYDPPTDTWSRGPAMPAPRCGYGLVGFDDKLYLFGGWNGKSFEDTIFVYSPEYDRWQESDSKLPRPIGYMGAAVLNDLIYIAGGYDGQQELDQTYTFEPAKGQWQEKSLLNEKRGGLGLVSNGSNLFAIGGGWDHPLQTSEKYNPTTDTWETFTTPFDNQWRNLGLAVFGTKIYAVGGWDGTDNKYVDSVVSYQFLHQFFLPLSATGN